MITGVQRGGKMAMALFAPENYKQIEISAALQQKRYTLTRPQFWNETVHNANQKTEHKLSLCRFPEIHH